GLAPLISHVRKLGMDFGIWVEPEMISEDSELFQMHPDWALISPDYEPVRSRNQLVLNLVHAPAYEYVFSKLDKLLNENEISFIKWDMNRPHVQATLKSGAAGTHEQTLAFYKLVDQLREKHRHIEIESCSSGGGRIDHEILRRTDRVWTSDCIDPYRRQKIQRGASMFIPNEVMGAHIGAEKAHTTSRVHSLEFRAISAVFGHLGLELDLTICSQSELQLIKQAIDWHKKFRGLLHSGDSVRFDCESASQISHGVYSPDRNEALVSLVQLTETKHGEYAQF
ncbi:MAG: glycoside hydrolase family 36 protein, partial [Acidimicrobiaceae bacterium]